MTLRRLAYSTLGFIAVLLLVVTLVPVLVHALTVLLISLLPYAIAIGFLVGALYVVIHRHT